MKKYRITAVLAVCTLFVSGISSMPAVYTNAEDEDTGFSETITDSGTIVSGDWTYYADDDGNAHITACTSQEQEIFVPAEIDGFPVTEIEKDTFMSLPAVKINLPDSIVYISAENPFAPCENLTEITVDSANENYTSEDGVLFTKDMKTLMCYPTAKSGTSFTIPDGVETLGIAAVYGTELQEIILPDSLKTMNRHCLSYNEKLEKIDMSSTAVEEIGIMALVNCTTLKEVSFSESTFSIGLAAFMSCKSLEAVELPPYLTEIGQGAFQDTALTKVKIPSGVESIGYCAFGYDEDENAVEGFLIIGDANSAAQIYATDTDADYDYANNFTFMTTETAERAEKYDALNIQRSGNFEYTVIDGEACITGCNSIDSVVNVPEEIDGYSVTSLYDEAFSNCSSPEIILPDTILKIGENAFPATVESITISGNCKEIAGDEPFLFCTSLKEINTGEGDGEYSSLDGVLYNKDMSLLITYPMMKEDTEFTAPDSCKEIAVSGFCYNQFVEKVNLPAVETINHYAFEGCPKISSVKLSDNIKFVGVNAFLGCTSLSGIRIPDGIETIGDYAFGYDYDEELAADIQANMEQYAQSGATNIMPYSVVDGYKIYADEDTLGYKYAVACGIEVVSGTVAIGSKNVDKIFIYVISGAVALLILIVSGIFIGKSASRKKKEKKSAQRKKSAGKKEENNNES
ncbi:MAG: leucine-rich repeat domain-containing protein [Ruminococcus sp.]|nr:leucine-rich repeat domain-containing protein [Ruminococcus sp.]MDE7226033.1 leucine-rich repeat domain-containing protein [Ruminococcus sp.]